MIIYLVLGIRLPIHFTLTIILFQHHMCTIHVDFRSQRTLFHQISNTIDTLVDRGQRMHQISSTESQKGVNAVQQHSVENQKGKIATDFVQQVSFWFSTYLFFKTQH